MNIEIKDTLISEEQLQAKVKELALQIERDFEGARNRSYRSIKRFIFVKITISFDFFYSILYSRKFYTVGGLQ